MPLLTSPIDGSPMKQISRFGIEIDVCPTTGGIWMDKGELEKLMAMIREAAMEEQGSYSPPKPQGQPRAVYEEPRYQEQRSYGGSEKHHKHEHPQYKKKSRFSDIMDIFDFG